MDEALAKSGEWPNVAIEAGSDPAKVMERYGVSPSVSDADKRPIVSDYARHIAATLGRGECENVAPDYLDFLCSVCGFVHYHSDENDTGDGNDWAYCPRCGEAVKQ